MNTLEGTVLLIGYGNPGRLDDGLGPALAEAATKLADNGLIGGRVTVESCFQLAVEHAAQVANYDVVIFADADLRAPEPYRFERLQPSTEAAFTTHHVEPATLLGLARDLFGATPEAYVLGIRGYEFNDFGEHLSPKAQKNLAAAERLLESQLQN
jgi:hydrogenase maturation protease